MILLISVIFNYRISFQSRSPVYVSRGPRKRDLRRTFSLARRGAAPAMSRETYIIGKHIRSNSGSGII